MQRGDKIGQEEGRNECVRRNRWASCHKGRQRKGGGGGGPYSVGNNDRNESWAHLPRAFFPGSEVKLFLCGHRQMARLFPRLKWFRLWGLVGKACLRVTRSLLVLRGCCMSRPRPWEPWARWGSGPHTALHSCGADGTCPELNAAPPLRYNAGCRTGLLSLDPEPRESRAECGNSREGSHVARNRGLLLDVPTVGQKGDCFIIHILWEYFLHLFTATKKLSRLLIKI